MKKKLILTIICMVFVSFNVIFATEKTVDFTNHKTIKSGNADAYFRGDDIVLPANKWFTYSANVKFILENGCTMRTMTYQNGKTHVSSLRTGICIYEKDGEGIDFYNGYVKEAGKWETIERHERIASGYDQKDRGMGLVCHVSNDIVRGDKKITKANIEFSSVKGVYNGDAYDVICKVSDEKGAVCTVLYKDVKIDADHDCTHVSLSNLSTKDIIDDENNKVFAIVYPLNITYKPIMAQTAAAGYIEPGYKTEYASEKDPAWENSLYACGGINIKNEAGDQFVDEHQGEIEYGSFSDGEDMEIDPSYGMIYFNCPRCLPLLGTNEVANESKYGYFGIIKPEKVTKDGKEIKPTYEYISTPGTYKGIDYTTQLVMKDGNNIIGRYMLKNAFIE